MGQIEKESRDGFACAVCGKYEERAASGNLLVCLECRARIVQEEIAGSYKLTGKTIDWSGIMAASRVFCEIALPHFERKEDLRYSMLEMLNDVLRKLGGSNAA